MEKEDLLLRPGERPMHKNTFPNSVSKLPILFLLSPMGVKIPRWKVLKETKIEPNYKMVVDSHST